MVVRIAAIPLFLLLAALATTFAVIEIRRGHRGAACTLALFAGLSIAILYALTAPFVGL
ncbi:hypothetical protein [Sphingomonas crocodyli]|uniref:hypothetical protein n=1 Tax=Sphingomonas crocodyli TaxID=1979270 RepID=UPI0013E31788|nr:hypothetical protein [Sphingomonas crocodyli]